MNGLVALLGRVLLAAIFILSGISKFQSPVETTAAIASVGIPLADIAYWATVLLEVVGGVLLIAGFQTRLMALGLFAFTLATAFLFHFDFGDQMQMIMFMKNIAIAGGLMQVMAFGGGALSIDGRKSGG
ncbi:MAG TPA: DoxX family protein [Micropepsaceae bacterium]|nr:DoxX family protein [Micropepsaceae bacterium]